MTSTRIALVTATVLIATTTIASADYYSSSSTRGIDATQANQERRLQQGLRSGELTRGEYTRLEGEQARIRQMERQAKADGYVSPAERARIRDAQGEASRHIYQEKHDAERRGQHQHRPWYRW
jgi:uncharacterized membrane protein YebE (DUF533 family)